MRRKRCVCGFMADVDQWNAKGVVMYCPECGAFDLSRDDLYEMGLQTRMMRVFLDRWRKQMKADAENPEIDDEAYRSACEMAVEMADEMFRGLEDADREWRDERRSNTFGKQFPERKELVQMRGMGYETPEGRESVILTRIAKALERIADAEEERNRMARKAQERLDRLDVLREDAEREGLRWRSSTSPSGPCSAPSPGPSWPTWSRT